MTDDNAPLDLSGLQMTPDWVSKLDQGSVADLSKRYGGSRDGDDRPPRGRGPGGGGGGGKGFGRKGQGDRGGKPGWGDQDRGNRGRPRRDGKRGGGPGDRKFGGPPRHDGPAPTPGLNASIRPSKSNLSALADMIKRSGRTFALIDLAKLFLASRDRYEVTLAPGESQYGMYGGPGPRGGKGKGKGPGRGQHARGKAPGQGESSESDKAAKPAAAPRLHVCQSDGSVWLTREEAVRHLIGSDVIGEHYGVEQVDVDPPKGNFAGIAVCGISGQLPPNHHSYQENLLALYRERFSHLPIERYKQKITVETGEEVVERWKAEQSTRSEWVFPKPEEKAEQPEQPATAAPTTEPEEAPPTGGAGDADLEPSGESPEPVTGSPSPEGETGADAGDSAATDGPADSGDPTAEATDSAPSAGTEPSTEETGEPAADESSESSGEETPSAEAPPAPAVETSDDNTVRLKSRAELERHFRDHLADSLIIETERVVVPGNIPGKRLSPGLLAHLKATGDHAQRSPSILIAPLCDSLGSLGLKFFRWGNGKQLFAATHRPRQLNLDTPLSPQIRAIFDFVRANPNAKPQDLLDKLAPAVEPEPAPEKAAEEASEEAPSAGKAAGKEATAAAAAAASPDLTGPQVAVLRDLRWLVAEGYIIEFSDGRLDAVKVHTPKPKPDPRPAAVETATEPPASESPASPEAGTPAPETTAPEVAPEPAAPSEGDSGNTPPPSSDTPTG